MKLPILLITLFSLSNLLVASSETSFLHPEIPVLSRKSLDDPTTTATPASSSDNSTANTTTTPADPSSNANAPLPVTPGNDSSSTGALGTSPSNTTAVNNSNPSVDDSDQSVTPSNQTVTAPKPGEAFLNHSSQQFIDPHGNTFDLVEYVKDLSPYAKEDIRDMNNPLKKDKALVGKPFYMENNITFDESPRIFHEIIETQVSKVETPITSASQYGLWKNWMGNKHFQDVSYVKRGILGEFLEKGVFFEILCLFFAENAFF